MHRFAIAIAAALLFAGVGVVRADGGRSVTWYIHGDTGSDSNSGQSPSQPHKTFGIVSMQIGDGDTICVAGKVYAPPTMDMLHIEGRSGITIKQWEGQAQAWLIGYVPLPANGWQSMRGSDAWMTTIAAGQMLDHVVFRYLSRVTASGRHYGFLKRDTLENTLSGPGNQGRWNFDHTSGVLTVNTVNAAPPGADVGYWIAWGRNAIRLVECSDTTVRGLKFACWPSATQGQAVRRINCRDTLVEDCEAHDCGSHSFSDEGRSERRMNNRSRHLRALGWNSSGTAYVTHSFGVNIEDGDWESCSFVGGRYLGENGLPLEGLPPNGQIGFYAHTSDGGLVKAGGFRLLGCEGYEDEPIFAAMSVDNGAAPADRLNFNDYPLQSIDSRFVVRGRLYWATRPNLGASAFRRCSFYFLTGSALNFGSGHGLIHEAFDNPHLWEHCEIIGDTTHASALVGMTFSQTEGVEFLFRRCTLIDRSVSPNPKTWFNYAFLDSRVWAEGCIIAFANTGAPDLNFGCYYDPSTPASNHAFSRNAYVNWSPWTCSQNGAFGTQALWASTIDPEAEFLGGSAAGMFPNLNTSGGGLPNGELAPGSPLWLLRRPDWTGAATGTGLNGLPDSGHYGAYQYGQTCYANCDGSTGTPVLTANDFLCFLNRVAAQDPAANCDGSTGSPMLTANDFLCFLNAVAAGCDR